MIFGTQLAKKLGHLPSVLYYIMSREGARARRGVMATLGKPNPWSLGPILFSVFLSLCSCQKEPPAVRLGFVGGLTGRYSDLGTSGRDGVILAVEERNRTGGLGGLRIELLIRDDKQDPQEAIRVDQELIAQGVVAIIGHMTSAMSLAVLPVINQAETVMVSPTTASPLLSGQRDFFFRVYEPVDREILNLARMVKEKLALRRLAALYDMANRAYSEDYAIRFQRAFEDLGGKVVYLGGIPTLPRPDPGEIEQHVGFLPLLGADGVLICLNALDTIQVLRHLRRAGWEGKAVATAWAMTKEVLEQGGQSVEGLYGVLPFLPEHPSEPYNRFKRAFQERFRREPDFPAVWGYEAAQVVFSAYERVRSGGKPLARAILEMGRFDGLQSQIAMDEYGDPFRDKFLVLVRAGRMERIER